METKFVKNAASSGGPLEVDRVGLIKGIYKQFRQWSGPWLGPVLLLNGLVTAFIGPYMLFHWSRKLSNLIPIESLLPGGWNLLYWSYLLTGLACLPLSRILIRQRWEKKWPDGIPRLRFLALLILEFWFVWAPILLFLGLSAPLL
jgi:hypothetical protein